MRRKNLGILMMVTAMGLSAVFTGCSATAQGETTIAATTAASAAQSTSGDDTEAAAEPAANPGGEDGVFTIAYEVGS